MDSKSVDEPATMPTSRRRILAGALTSPFIVSAQAAPKLNIVVTGGHPGDPECGCAGTIARYASLGHNIVLLYLNRGEGFCSGGGPADCARIRTAEAQKASQILKARAVFATQIDGQAVVDNAHYQEIRLLMDAEKPDIVFAQWPIDQHRDHRALSQMVLDAWLTGGRKSAFYYYEVAEDTMMFSPAEFVDISAPEIESARRAACYAHASQQPGKWYPKQVQLTMLRGAQSGHSQAEGFVRHWQSIAGQLP
jgi:LmbE family N-acetylglucosaminyl deacetylase